MAFFFNFSIKLTWNEVNLQYNTLCCQKKLSLIFLVKYMRWWWREMARQSKFRRKEYYKEYFDKERLIHTKSSRGLMLLTQQHPRATSSCMVVPDRRAPWLAAAARHKPQRGWSRLGFRLRSLLCSANRNNIKESATTVNADNGDNGHSCTTGGLTENTVFTLPHQILWSII